MARTDAEVGSTGTQIALNHNLPHEYNFEDKTTV